MNNFSPHGSSPAGDYYYYDQRAHGSPTATPSPRDYYPQTPQQPRPATRAYFHTRRGSNAGFDGFSPSPRYTSTGQYATATVNVSSSRSARKHHWASPRTERKRRNSYSYYRASDSHGESDEDEYFEIDGVTYVLPARSRSRRYSNRDQYYDDERAGGYGTDYHYYGQTPFPHPAADRGPTYPSPRHREAEQRPAGHSRRASFSTPQRPSTARPASSHQRSASKQQATPATPRASKKPPPAAQATEADAKKYRIPKGYSLKNWDPAEQPILLLGSVFDSNSLGKWIYDWTVYVHGAGTPMSDVAGELWLLLIQLYGKLKRAEEIMPVVRTDDNRDMLDDFITSGERLIDKLAKLLKACEAPMLNAGPSASKSTPANTSSKRKESQLGKNAGVEFIETLFGRERELETTNKFMQSIRLWDLRFNANCEKILKNPTA